ncbi:NAD-dependent epimerase/dehydratase family protein [Acinetobacter qingfengensis]|uniref:UDP-glucose 4-epimerase n=1 Tax=Acinetobacter qingfengensis TaxID=1262585 RepID=A0A1E7RCH2_9GAMM|nr:SDR family NAD(P)-dependent oxidoreductase [Acinetobacter qingfengensis]KAA8734825.1 NAD-dependent epimerase/dehydratase family protein [Acinetobacter qingfengensis]OEY96865.1 UDP-glucose 4-epimerase [Acinetobacter qingfengensis]
MILVTGGLGYLGSHIALDLMSRGHEVVLVDNLSQSSMPMLERLEYNTNLYIPFIRMDVRNTPVLQKVFEQYPIDYVIHTAGFKSVNESVLRPLDYYNNNQGCLMSVLRAMQRSGVKRLVNLSSAMVYGQSGEKFKEDDEFHVKHQNPYVRAQQQNEQILHDVFRADDYWQISNLRLSNVVGAYTDSKIGEWVAPLPKSVLLNILQVAAQQRDIFELYHQDLDTQDGSSERDFIHVMDVVNAVYKLMIWSNNQQNFLENFNLGSSQLTSILQLIQQVETVTKANITQQPYPEITEEFAQVGINIEKIQQTIDWKPEQDLAQAITDQWNFYQKSLGLVDH